MFFQELFSIKQKERNDLVSYVIDSSAPTADFYFLIMLSTLIVGLGLISNNIILVIGGMLVTPLLYPIISLALGIIINKSRVIFRSLKITLFSLLFALVVAFLLGLLIPIDFSTIDLVQMMEPSWSSFSAAVIAGLAASYTWCKKDLNNSLPAVAITVTLIPPLTSLGLTLSKFNWELSLDIGYFFVLNLFGVILASLIVFLAMNFYKAKRTIVKEVKEEEKDLKK